jgi:hypothetical protein
MSCIEEGHPSSHGCALNLQVMTGVEGEVVDEDEVGERQEKCCMRTGDGRTMG